MKRKRYSEEQIISILNEREAGASVADLARMHGVAEQSIHRWKSKYAGMTVSDLKRLKRRVRRTCERSAKVADPGLDHADARGRHRNVKKALTPAAKRKAAGGLRKARRTANGGPAACWGSTGRWPGAVRSRGVATGRWRTACASWPGGAPATAA